MVWTKEQKREYNKIYRQKNKEKEAAYMKIYRENNKEYHKIYRENNKQKIKEYYKKYNEENRQKILDKTKKYYKTPNGKKLNRKSTWKRRGIVFDNFEYWYDAYVRETDCWFCEKEFKNSKDRHLDHDHRITDRQNVRAILCRSCNTKDVLKDEIV